MPVSYNQSHYSCNQPLVEKKKKGTNHPSNKKKTLNKKNKKSKHNNRMANTKQCNLNNTVGHKNHQNHSLKKNMNCKLQQTTRDDELKHHPISDFSTHQQTTQASQQDSNSSISLVCKNSQEIMYNNHKTNCKKNKLNPLKDVQDEIQVEKQSTSTNNDSFYLKDSMDMLNKFNNRDLCTQQYYDTSQEPSEFYNEGNKESLVLNTKEKSIIAEEKPTTDRNGAPEEQAIEEFVIDEQCIEFISNLSSILEEIVEAGNCVPLHPSRQYVSIFHNRNIPPISINRYLERILRFTNCSTECLILALIYLDKIVEMNSKFFISSLNIHRLLITSVLVAAKFHNDHNYKNSHYSKVGGVSKREMNSLELEFLSMIDYNLHVPRDVFEQYECELINN